ncbi:type II toxin-antitoxin system HicB family antitoxin [Propionivibrio sp.]|uniref:type II toxin-antitoxin system HicB family antitoxin n=1 Tax=Propionivibrio sp. TaxID=2212460 RepID=UPI003BF1483E
MGTLKYKEFEGTVEYDSDRAVLRGKILFISDVITYESDDVEGIAAEFQAAVEDYVNTCEELGRPVQKPCNGVFSVRIPPALHRQALTKAARENKYLNDIVSSAIDSYLNGSKGINNINVTIQPQNDSPIIAAATTAMNKASWENRRVH